MDDKREKEVIELCRKVLDANTCDHYNGNGPDTSTCPFCGEETRYISNMEEIAHAQHCAYLLAKDLSTGLL